MSTSLPNCANRTKAIIGNWSIRALGRAWHPECFACYHCGKRLDAKAFYYHRRQDNEPEEPRHNQHCKACFSVLYMPNCRGCGKMIEPGDVYWRACGAAFHPTCFRCGRCDKQLQIVGYQCRSNHPFCAQCFESKPAPATPDKDLKEQK